MILFTDSRLTSSNVRNLALNIDDAASAFILLVEEALKPNGGKAQWGSEGYYFAEGQEFVSVMQHEISIHIANKNRNGETFPPPSPRFFILKALSKMGTSKSSLLPKLQPSIHGLHSFGAATVGLGRIASMHLDGKQ